MKTNGPSFILNGGALGSMPDYVGSLKPHGQKPFLLELYRKWRMESVAIVSGGNACKVFGDPGRHIQRVDVSVEVGEEV
jgi:hypothetical protein